MKARRPTATGLVLLLLAACTSTNRPPIATSPSFRDPIFGPYQPGGQSKLPELKLRILFEIDRKLAYCDPDLYPVEHGTLLENARARLPAIKSDSAAFRAIAAAERIDVNHLSDNDLLVMNDDYKKMLAIDLRHVASGYAFNVNVGTGAPSSAAYSLSGQIGTDGIMSALKRAPARNFMCPICLAAGSLIDTPSGQVPVAEVHAGSFVWSIDVRGRRIVEPVERVGAIRGLVGHIVIAVELSDGRRFVASPGHPLSDGRLVGSLRLGDAVDRATVASIGLRQADATYDLLPAGPTGLYFVDGIPIRSTIGIRGKG